MFNNLNILNFILLILGYSPNNWKKYDTGKS